jgi:hypothetical protein
MMSEYILARIQAIQQELEELRKGVAHQVVGLRRRTKLKGLWKGVVTTEEDLAEAERAVFKDVYKFDE